MYNTVYQNRVPLESQSREQRSRTRNNFYPEGTSNMHELTKRLQTAMPMGATPFQETKSLLSRDY